MFPTIKIVRTNRRKLGLTKGRDQYSHRTWSEGIYESEKGGGFLAMGKSGHGHQQGFETFFLPTDVLKLMANEEKEKGLSGLTEIISST